MVNYYSYGIFNEETLYGPDERFVLWFKGCSLKCYKCSSSHLWDKNDSKQMTVDVLIKLIINSKVCGVTFLGGEPLEQDDIYNIIKKIYELNVSIVLFTGYELEELNEEQLKIKDMCDFFICGRYIHEKRNLKLQFRGSSNQRVFFSNKYKDYLLKDDVEHSNIIEIDNCGNVSIIGFENVELNKIIE